MSGFSSMFSQLLKLFPRTEFQALVKRTHAERHARGFTCWGQFVAMLFCQLGRAHSLREICGGLRSSEGKLRHLGITAPARSTLAYANEHRPWQLYQTLFEQLLGICMAEAKGKKIRWPASRKYVKGCITTALKDHPTMNISEVRRGVNLKTLRVHQRPEWGCEAMTAGRATGC